MNGINLSNVDAYKSTPHSNFDLSFSRKFDGKFGDIHPVLCLPVMPDDIISLSHSVMLRMAPFIQQVFQDYNVVMGYYYVPNRVLWHNFSKFMTGGSRGNTEYVHPYIDLNRVPYAKTSLPYGWLNMFDVPRRFANDKSYNLRLNALPFAAYCRVLLDYFLPQADTALSSLREDFNQEQLLRDGDNTASILNLLLKFATSNPNANMQMVEDDAAYGFDMPQCLYPLDYFTSARPDTQFGPAMTIPVQLVNTDADGTSTFKLISPAGENISTTGSSIYVSAQQGSTSIRFSTTGATPSNITVNGSVFNNVATINDFYQAARIQELLALYGYAGLTSDDKIAAEFGVQNPNTSLQRAQLLGYDTLNVGIGEVFSSDVSQSSEALPKMIPGAGTAVGKLNQGGNGFRAHFLEHGYIIGVCFCYPEAAYEDGLPRYLRLSDRFDYPHPLFANIGMQSIKREEICVTGSTLVDRGDFAYTSRYGDYKVGVNRVNGALQTSLSSMVAGRKLIDSAGDVTFVYPEFNDRFLRVDPAQNRLNRTFNVLSDLPTDKPLFFDVKFNIDAYRPLPYYGLPKF